MQRVRDWVMMPTQAEANRQKQKFYATRAIPSVIGCIDHFDGTHIHIQGPNQQDHEFVNRMNYHWINVQVICDADLKFINVVARWPGSVHNARIMRNCLVCCL